MGKLVKKMYWEELPLKYGIGANINKLIVDWNNCTGCSCKFEYDKIMGFVEIISYDSIGEKVCISYEDKNYVISTEGFKNCNFRNIVGNIPSDFLFNVGCNITSFGRNFIITHREHRRKLNNYKKHYKYTCNKCGWTEGWMEEGRIKRGKNCSCCINQKIISGINDIFTTDYWMIELGVDEDFAKNNSRSTDNKAPVKCIDCGREFLQRTDKIYRRKNISCSCGDGTSYPEKYVSEFLNQIGVKYQYQLTKGLLKWCGDYRYDFLINDEIIVEVHGLQHYENSTRGKSLLEEQGNDKVKKELALLNGIKEENYIVIDCRYSESEFIRNNILNSKLSELYDLRDINWDSIGVLAMSNISKIACDMYNNNPNLTTAQIGDILKRNGNTICKWLKQWAKLGLCSYVVTDQFSKRVRRNCYKQRKKTSACNKRVYMYKDNIYIDSFESVNYLAQESENLFGVKLNAKNISQVATGKRKSHKGYTFKYTNQEVV